MRAVALSAIPLLAVATTVAADEAKPVFKPTSIKGNFVEQFTDDWSERWTISEATKKTPVGSETFAYVGTWAVEDGEPVLIDGDKGLVAKSKAAHHAISAPFPKPVDFGTQPLVVQYEVKYQKGGNCGGGYVKLLEDGFQTSGKEFDDKTPWVVMFGPDLTCPGTKVHFIFRHKNPVTGEYEEKHLRTAPTPSINSETNLYTLAVFPNQTYEVFFNGKSQSTGSLLEDFSPAVNPDKEIDDTSDTKPSDWVDEKRITDPEATKPEDWDEDAPYEIVDEEATKPEGWLDDEPEMIPDPDSEKPEEWDDEEDGDWVAPMIRNPKCDDAPGCGEWKRPNKPNPAYKGKWFAPMIDNPAYIGEWAPRKIANPAFFEDNEPTKSLNKIGGVGIELWTMTEDILFDNIYVGHSLEDAQKLATETYEVKHTAEDAIKPVDTPLDAPVAALPSFQENPVGFVRQKVLNFVDAAKVNPVEAVKSQPDTAGALAAGLFTLFGMLGATLGLLGGSAAPVTKAVKKTDTSTTDKAAASKSATVKMGADETVPTTTIKDKNTGETLSKRKGT